MKKPDIIQIDFLSFLCSISVH